MSSIFTEKESTNTSDKVETKAENEKKSEPEQAHTNKRRRKTKLFPSTTNKCLLYFALTIAFHKLPTIG